MDYRSFWIYGIEDTVKIIHLFRFTLLMWLLETFPWHLWLVPSPQGSSGLQTGLLSSGEHPRPGPSLQEEARRRGSPPGGGAPLGPSLPISGDGGPTPPAGPGNHTAQGEPRTSPSKIRRPQSPQPWTPPPRSCGGAGSRPRGSGPQVRSVLLMRCSDTPTLPHVLE